MCVLYSRPAPAVQPATLPACEWCGTKPIAWSITDRFGHGLGAGCCGACLSGAVASLVPGNGHLTVCDVPAVAA